MQDWNDVRMIYYRLYENGLLINEGHETTDGRSITETVEDLSVGMGEEEKLEYFILGKDETLKAMIKQLKNRLDDLEQSMEGYMIDFLPKHKFRREIYDLNKKLKENLR